MTGSTKGGAFSAADASLGYLYQVRSALLWALRRLRTEPDFLVSVETLDDVTFANSGGEAVDLLQTKHHRVKAAALTDASVDLWKTLRIWFEGCESGQIPKTANLFLITTALAPDGSAASRLRSANRDQSSAKSALDAVASSSSNLTNQKAYEAYLKTTSGQRSAILDRITVIDAAPLINDLESELRQEVYWAAEREHHAAFLERLEGWWYRRILLQLSGSDADRVGSVEIESKMSDLREQFKQEALPIDDDLLQFTLDDLTKAAHEDSAFVRQMEIIQAGKRRVANAIRDFYRAFEQRSRWLREELIESLDLQNYERRLTEEWELVFDAVRDDLGEEAAEEMKEKAARSVLTWAERTTIPIRPAVTEPFISRGSLHILSDELRIGWHPDFRERLASILDSEEKSA